MSLRQRHSPELIRLDKEYRAWIQAQPSCISGTFSEYMDGQGKSLAAHVRRAGSSGTSYKAIFSCVPLTREEHDLQHQKGEVTCLFHYLPPRHRFAVFGGLLSEQFRGAAAQWFDEQAAEYLARWQEETNIKIPSAET